MTGSDKIAVTPEMVHNPVAWATNQLERAQIESARFEAQLLLALALNVSRVSVIAQTYPCPSSEQWQAFANLVQERCRHTPLAYLRGSQEFYGLTFTVTPDVLIPRPETELLVEFALEMLQAIPDRQPPIITDVGAGSGCIGIAILANNPGARALSLDISAPALAIARNNAQQNGVSDRIRFVRSDLISGVGRGTIDILVSNPPYIPDGEIPILQPEVRDFEPRLALEGGPDGLAPHRRLAANARHVLRPHGWIATEVALGQAAAVAAIFHGAGLHRVTTRQDLMGIDRIVCASIAS